MKMMRSGLFEYQVAAKMVEIHEEAGCETEAYAPIVGSGINSTVLHYNKLDRQIDGGEVVLLDVAGQFSGYAADVTRTLPADGKFHSPPARIYEIVLGAQNAALAALKPGTSFRDLQKIANGLYQFAMGRTRRAGRWAGTTFTALAITSDLTCTIPAARRAPLEPGMVITVEPGIYIPEENIGMRIEDDVLITPTGYKAHRATAAHGRRDRKNYGRRES